MRRPPPSLLALALAALLLAACTDSDGDAAETTTAPTSASTPTSAPPDETDESSSSGGPSEEAFADQLVAFGFEEEEADCLAAELAEGGLDASAIEDLANDPGMALAAVQACDIPLTRLLELAGAALGGTGGDASDALTEAITQALSGSGAVSEEQARCVADELLAQGRDVTALSDLAALEPILEGCGVSGSDIGG